MTEQLRRYCANFGIRLESLSPAQWEAVNRMATRYYTDLQLDFTHPEFLEEDEYLSSP